MKWSEMEFGTFTNLFMSNGHDYLVALSKKIELFDLPSLTKVSDFTGTKNPYYACFSNDDKILAVKSTTGEIGVYSVETKILQFKVRASKPCDGSNFLFTPDNRYIVDGDWDGNIRQIDLSNGSVKIVQKNENTMIKKIEFDEGNSVYHITKFYRGGKSVLDEHHTSISKWKYDIDKKTLLYVCETKKQVSIGPITFDSMCEKYYSFEKESLSSERMCLRVFDRNLDTMLSRKNVDGICYTDPSDCSVVNNGKYLLGYCDNTLRLFCLPQFEIVFEINSKGIDSDPSSTLPFEINTSTFSLSPDKKFFFWPRYFSGEKKPWRVMIVCIDEV